MQLMLRMTALASCLFMVSACADDSDGGSDASLPQCVDISGSWTIEEHCQADLVGDEVVVAQDGCDFSDETFGFSGTTGLRTAVLVQRFVNSFRDGSR